MRSAWLFAHRSVIATSLSSTLVAALVATVAIVSGGYTAQRLDLGDAAVWVTNEARQSVGRANQEVLELNTVVAAAGSSLDVVQQGASVFVVDHGNSSLGIVDPATAEVAEKVALPPVKPAVYLAGDRAVIASNGDVWTMPAAAVADFDGQSEPTLSLGAGAVVSMDQAGVFFSYTPATGDLVRVDTARGDAVTSTQTVHAGAPHDDYQLSSVDGRWALLDATTGSLYLPGREIDLSALDDPVLQQAAVTGDRILVAHRKGLLAVPFTGDAPSVLATGRAGAAAAPAIVGDCSYAAWGDGAAWHECAGSPPVLTTLEGTPGDARLAFRTNGTSLVLNDAHTGATWAVQRGGELIDNWDELIDTEQDKQRVEENTADTPPEFEKTQAPPVAVDDEFGARPGRTATLPVLLNDYDPNDDVLMITGMTEIPAREGRLELVANNQQIQVTLAPDAPGPVNFGYTISDGRGGEASARVSVAVRADDENSPPVQARVTHASVQSAGRVVSQVLGDWVDPDGDAFYLTAASAVAPDQAGFTPDGAVSFTDAGAGDTQKQVGLIVSDGRLEGTGQLSVAVRPAGSVPLIAESFPVVATVGTEVTVSPLGHVRGGSGPIRLTSVPAKPDVTITPSWDAGTFRVTSGAVGTHLLEYAVTDGEQTVTGQVRLEILPDPDSSSAPITVPHTAYIRGQEASIVDVLATDIDPAGGVLLVTGTLDVPPASGLRVEVLERRLLRVTLTRPLLDGPVTFSYRVSNGLAESVGTVTVIELPALAHKQAPIAKPDTVSVRVGDTIDIPVLDNDEHPDGDALTLAPTLATGLTEGSGLLFASGAVLRYLAPDTAGNFTAVYRVSAPDGQFANAEVHISVREADADSNNPPVPKTVTARVLAGGTVSIPIPLSGIDPDGDSVQLIGQETSPEKGSVTTVGSDSIEYKAGEYSAGTDTFTYAVVDALGSRATGLVRVGISPRLDGARNPIAVPDEVVVRPGSTVSVRVLANDSDPDGGQLSIVSVEPSGAGSAVANDQLVSVTAPRAPGRYGFIYQIQNERGGTSSTFLTVVVAKDAPLAHPDAQDTKLTLSDVRGRDTIDVDVLAHVFFADGPATELGLSVLPGFGDTAQVTKAKRIRVTMKDDSQIIPFAVTHPDDPGIVSYAFIWVPGYSDALPQLRTGVTRLSVPSESGLSIDINRYVVAVGGKKVRLTDQSTVRATHSDGTGLVTSADTLQFTSAAQYYGPASISFEVTDGTSASDPDGHTATIVLPITVTPRQNQPPAFDGAVIDFEPDQTKVIDLHKLTSYPYPDDQGELAYSVLDPKPTGFTYSLDGGKLTLRATESTQKGSQSALTIGVRDGVNQGRAGRIEVRVVASTRPLAVPAADTAIAQRGQTTVVDVLANDGATNPFPTVPLAVIAVRGLDSERLPAGVTVTPSADRTHLSFKVAPDAAPMDTTVQYQVADATGDPDRYAWGTVRVSVQDRPEPVTSLRVNGFTDRGLSVSFNAGAANNSPVSGYEVTLLGAASGEQISTVTCQATACDVATPGNGQSNRVRVSVAARNGVGLSAASVLADPVWSDVVPPAPAGLTAAPLDRGLRLGWTPVGAAGGGTPVRGYVVTVGGVVQSGAPTCGPASCALDLTGLSNGSAATVTVSARNDAYPALAAWNSASVTGTPFGAPRSGSISATGTDASGTVNVSWDEFDGNGAPMLGYYVQRLARNEQPSGAQACTVSSGQVTAPQEGGIVEEQKFVPAGKPTSQAFEGLMAGNRSYSFIVWGYNPAGCVPTPVATVLLRPPPVTVTAADVSAQMAARGRAWDYEITGVGGGYDHFNLRAAGDSGMGIPFSGAGWPRELLHPAESPRGETVAFQLQGCGAWACADWSETLTAPGPSVDLTVTGVSYDGAAGVFSWTNGPANGPDLPASYTCSVPGDETVPPTDAGSPTTCTFPGPPPPAGTVRLTVTVDGHSYDYDE